MLTQRLTRLRAFCLLLTIGGGIAYANAITKNDVAIVQQTGTCQGQVVDVAGEPIIGATVLVKGTANGTLTDLDGNFSLSNVRRGDVLHVSYVGYVPQEVKWTGETLRVVLKEDTQALGEVVVVAFGTQKKVNLTGAVSSVGAKEISARPVSSTIEALQGVVPGMNIGTGSGGGALNAGKTFNIRGIGTIGAGSKVEPLVLIDGMEGDINALNPQDIENISVLKDAASSSIYGSRAPGGVILITTKKGKAGKAVVNYNNSFRFVSPLNLPEMVDSYSFANSMNELKRNQGESPIYSETKLKQILDFQQGKSTQYMWPNSNGAWNYWDDPAAQNILPAANTNWLETHFGGSKLTQEHTLSISGGSEAVKYYLSANYLDQAGLLNYGDDNRQRYSLTAKINADVAKWFNVGYSMRFNRVDYDAPSYLGNGFYFDVVRYWPTQPLKDPNGFYGETSKVYQLTEGGRYITQHDVVAHQLAMVFSPMDKWKINVELNYRTNYNFDHTDWLTTFAYNVDKTPYATMNQTTAVQEYAYKTNFFNPNIFTEYRIETENGHNAKVLLGYQSELYKARNITAKQEGIMSGIPTINTTQNNPTVKGGYDHWATVGFFGRLNYDYQGKYLAEVNMRYDGTSRFLREKRWNLFPSFSLGWNIAQEEFFKNLTKDISTLKLRASWGELGNQNTDNFYPFYRQMDLKSNDGSWLVGGKKPNTASEPALVSALLTWERTQTLDIGFDLAMLNNRLNMSFDYFQRKSIDMVGPAPELPEILGIGVPRVNNLDMTSRGWELQVSWRDQIQDFKYGATLSLSDSRVRIDKYPNPSKSLNAYFPGRYIGDIWGFETIGIAKTQAEMDAHLATLSDGGQSAIGSGWAAGDIMYADLNGDKKINTGNGTLDNPGDLKLIGNSTPRYNFGLNLDAAYKGFDLKVFFQGTLKRDYMPGSGNSAVLFWGGVGYWQANFYKNNMDYFRGGDTTSPLGANVDSYLPRPLYGAKNRQSQTRYLQNAAYARLKNITLGYTLPSALTRKFHVENLRLFVSAENLFTITSLSKAYDPETIGIGYDNQGSTYPLSKTVSFGLSVTL